MQTIGQKPITPSLAKLARLLDLAGDRARIRILCLLFEQKRICVSDISRSLKMSIASISHHLQLMSENGLVTSERDGKNICYTLLDSQFTKDLKKLICNGEKYGKQA